MAEQQNIHLITDDTEFVLCLIPNKTDHTDEKILRTFVIFGCKKTTYRRFLTCFLTEDFSTRVISPCMAQCRNKIDESMFYCMCLVSKEQEVSHWQQIAICKSLILITVLYYISFLPFFLYQCVIYYSPHSLLYFSPIAYRALKAFRNLSSVTDGAIFYGMSNRLSCHTTQL